MTLDDLNLPKEETSEVPAPVFTLDSLEEPAEPAPVFTLDSMEETPEETSETPPELIPEPIPEAVPEPIPEPVPEPVPQPAPIPQPMPVAQPVHIPAPAQTAPKSSKARRRKPHIALRIPLQLLSFVLTFVLFAVVICGALLADLRQITSEGGIKKIVNALLVPNASAPITVHPAPIEVDLMNSDADAPVEGTIPGDIFVDGDNISIGDDITIDIGQLPDDILGGGGGEANVLNLADWIYEQIDASTDKPLKFTKSEFQDFVQESTFNDFISEKLAGFADDFINNTENTRITSREILKLLEENEDLMRTTLHVEPTDEQWEQIETGVKQLVEENDINATIRDKVYTAVDNVLEENAEILGDMKREDLQAFLQLLTSDLLFYGFVGAAVLLLLLLCLLNFYNVPAGLTWASFPTMIAGAILSIPILALQHAADVVVDLLPGLGSIIGVLASFVDVFAPIHYGLLLIGVGLLVVSIIWRIIRAVVRKNRVAV